MKKIVPQPKDDSLLAQLVSLYEVFRGVSIKQDLEFDLSSLKSYIPIKERK